MARAAAVVVASWTLKAGRKPPSGIFMARASGSVGDTRGVASLAPLFFLIAATLGSSASACSSRSSRSCATRAIVAAWRAVRGVGRRAGDLDEVGTGFRHEPLEGLTASKRRSAGGGADAGAVLGDAMEIDEVVFHEPERGQITWGRVDLDAEVPADHEVRAIAAVVDKLDLRGLCAEVRARGEIAGAPATDPKILLGLWAYATRDATRDGVGSGREIARLVELHVAYRWLCGGVAVSVTAGWRSRAARRTVPLR
jgi:hypothetical protein